MEYLWNTLSITFYKFKIGIYKLNDRTRGSYHIVTFFIEQVNYDNYVIYGNPPMCKDNQEIKNFFTTQKDVQ